MRILAAGSLAGLLLLGGCAFLAKLHGDPSHPSAAAPSAAAPPAAAPRDLSLSIPSDQLPPPGQCRVWLPDVAPGQQKASGPCASVQKVIPAGAWVLYRSQEKSNVVAVNVYRSKWPRTVAETRYFDYWTGRLLRVE